MSSSVYLPGLPHNPSTVTLQEADAAARAHLSSAGTAMVLVGPMASLRARLEQLDLGPIQVRDPSGKLVAGHKPRATAPR